MLEFYERAQNGTFKMKRSRTVQDKTHGRAFLPHHLPLSGYNSERRGHISHWYLGWEAVVGGGLPAIAHQSRHPSNLAKPAARR